MTDYQKYINALRKCANEHENDRTFTGHIIVSDLCRDTATLLEELSSSEIPTSSNDCISRADALRVAKNEYLRGWHNALCKALREKYSIHCEEGNFSVIQEETITGLGLSMNCAAGKDVESYMSTIPRVTPIRPKGRWINHSDEGYVECPKCGSATNCDDNITDLHFCFSCGAEMEGSEEV